MNKTTAALLAKICEAKGIELDAKLKNDVDTVLAIVTDELLEEGVAAKLEAINKRIATVGEKYGDAVAQLAKRLTLACGQMNELDSQVRTQQRAVESLIGKDGRRYMLPENQQRAQAARDIYAGMLDDSIRTLEVRLRNDPAIVTACIEAASLAACRYIDATCPQGRPEDKTQDFSGLKLKPQYANRQQEGRAYDKCR